MQRVNKEISERKRTERKESGVEMVKEKIVTPMPR